MEKYKLTIPRPTKAPTPMEELLKLGLLELTRKPHANVYVLYDECVIALKAMSMHITHKVVVIDDHFVEVIRMMHDLAILRLEPIKQEGA